MAEYLSLFKKKEYQPTVLFPSELEDNAFSGEVFGYYIPETEYFNILNFGENPKTNKNMIKLGYIGNDIPSAESEYLLFGKYVNERLIFMNFEKKMCISKPYSILIDAFSRNAGIIETPSMLKSKVVISGCGSVGSLVALELARAGVGHFLLIDNDILSLHNICRHQCGISDVGKYKTDALKDRILDINPKANITLSNSIIEETDKIIFDYFVTGNSIIVGCADNREGDLYANLLSKLYRLPFISIGFWERAFAGEIFYTINNDTPCYKCYYDTIGAISSRTNSNRQIYTFEENITEVTFEPGISVDINFVTIIAIKLIIDILNKDNNNYVPKIINSLSQLTLICNTNDSRIGGEMAEIFSYPLQVTTSIDVSFVGNCSDCQQCTLIIK